MEYKINVGDAIPQFSAKDQEGFEITNEDLFGSPVILYFYPQDGTSICTKEACSFQSYLQRYDDFDAVIIGVSPDSEESHQRFAAKNNLDFTLLSDPNLELCKKFDVIHEREVDGKRKMALERTTFFIDRDGIIQWIERPVNAEGHSERVLEAIKKYSAV